MAEDFYKTLGVSRDAPAADIQKAYRELARKYHPDLHPDDKDAKKKFQEVQAAFDVLNDQAKREQYDRYGSSFESAGAGGPRATWSWGNSSRRSRWTWRTRRERKKSISANSSATALAAKRRAALATSSASSGRPREAANAAPPPGQARGRSGHRSRNPLHHGDRRRRSPAFDSPRVGRNRNDRGQNPGRHRRRQEDSPPRSRRAGSRRGGTAGDILITVHVGTHPFFSRRGNNLDVKVPVTLAEAALGAKIDIPTPQGNHRAARSRRNVQRSQAAGQRARRGSQRGRSGRSVRRNPDRAAPLARR